MKPVTHSIFITAICSLSFAVIAEAKENHEIRPGRHSEVDRFDEIYAIVRNTMLIAVTPIVLSFLYSVYKDPATPIIAKVLWGATKRRVLGNLSK